MSITQLTTADELLRISSEANARGERCELVAGEVRYLPLGEWNQGIVSSSIVCELGRYIQHNKLGKIFGAETGFVLARDPDTVRAPDIAFVANSSIPAELPESGYWPSPPDLAVEVISTNDRAGEIDEKIQAWLDSGVKLLWVVDPELQIVTAYRSITSVTTYTRSDTIDSIDLLPGFTLLVSEIFP